MTATILKLLPDNEVRTLQTYIGGFVDARLKMTTCARWILTRRLIGVDYYTTVDKSTKLTKS